MKDAMKNLAYRDNYSCHVTFAKAHTLKPLYMRLLKVLIDHPEGLQRYEAINITHNLNNTAIERGTLIGPFLLLKGNGFATFERKGRHCFWKATLNGEHFYTEQCIQHDLLTKVA